MERDGYLRRVEELDRTLSSKKEAERREALFARSYNRQQVQARIHEIRQNFIGLEEVLDDSMEVILDDVISMVLGRGRIVYKLVASGQSDRFATGASVYQSVFTFVPFNEQAEVRVLGVKPGVWEMPGLPDDYGELDEHYSLRELLEDNESTFKIVVDAACDPLLNPNLLGRAQLYRDSLQRAE